MSCIHSVWNCYCKHKEEIIDTHCSPLCKSYCTEETSMKNILNKGPATNTNCTCNESTADNHCAKYCSTNFRFILTLILGYLGKLNTVDIMLCHEPKIYFKSQVDHTPVIELRKAVNKTRAYVEVSNDSNLAEGMRMVEQWFEEIAKENIPPKELTVADIEKQLGYKIKIVGEH